MDAPPNDELWFDLGPREALEPRLPLRVCVDGRPVGLYLWQQKIYALEDECPHASARLSAGTVHADGWVECPLHGWRYHVSDGNGFWDWQGSVRAYELREHDGSVWLARPGR